jgi:hypothetical protein
VIDMSRINAVAQTFLLWVSQQPHNQAQSPDFVADASASSVDGQQVDQAEIDDVVRLLVARGLLRGTSGFSGEVTKLVQLTDEGRVCVTEHNGNLERTDAARNHAGTYINQPVNVTGQGNQVAAFSSNVGQTQRTEISNVQTLREVARETLAGVDQYEIDEDDAETVRRVARRVLDETADGEPEPGRIARLARSLRSALMLFGNTAFGTEFADRLINLLMPLLNFGGGVT